jgi:hypothetical protein
MLRRCRQDIRCGYGILTVWWVEYVQHTEAAQRFRQSDL